MPRPAPFSGALTKLFTALEHLLFGDEGSPIVIALKGGWGEGKTYFWKNSVALDRGEKDPGYVSVFGAESLAAVQREVVVEALRTRPKGAVGDTLQKTIEAAYPFLRATKGVLNAMGGKFGFMTDAFTVPPELLQRVVLREGWVVCLDDIERLPANIGLDALFGYISTLRDEYKVNVVLIYNEDKVPDQRSEDLKRYAEKAVDREFPFLPTTSDIVKLVFKDSVTESTLNQLAEKCEVLRLRSIRILGRVKRYYEDVAKALPMSPEAEYFPTVLSSLLLLTWVKFARIDAGNLTLEFLEQFDGTWDIGDDDDEEEKDPRRRLLEKYPWFASDDLDRVLIQFVNTSTLDSEKLLDHYEDFVLEKKRDRVGERLNRAWEHFHGSFGDRETEFGNELYAVIKEEMEFVPIARMNSGMVELDRIGRRGDAQALLDQLKKQPLERMANYDEFSGKLTHPGLIELVADAKRKVAVDKRPLDEIIENALREGEELIQPRDRRRLAQFSEDDFYAYFSSTETPRLTAMLRDLVKATSVRGRDEYDSVINKKLRKVAQRLANTSTMNKSRIAAIGLLEDDQPTPTVPEDFQTPIQEPSRSD